MADHDDDDDEKLYCTNTCVFIYPAYHDTQDSTKFKSITLSVSPFSNQSWGKYSELTYKPQVQSRDTKEHVSMPLVQSRDIKDHVSMPQVQSRDIKEHVSMPLVQG